MRYSKNLERKLADKTKGYTCVVLHGITDFNSKVFLAATEKKKFVAMLWGAELYNEENFPDNALYGEITATLKFKQAANSSREKFKDIIRHLLYGNILTPDNSTKKAAKELSFLSSQHEEDFELFKKKKVLSEHCKHIPFSYFPVEYMIRGFENTYVNGNDILLGNSATRTNNHLEAFRLLDQFEHDARTIRVPLSYGNMHYAKYVQAKGNEIFNGNLKAIRGFLPLNEYIKTIRSCGIVVMNHYRQQAMGNTTTMLWLGSKVYLNESNTFYQYLKRIGVKVFSIEKELVKENVHALENLSESEMIENRQILKKYLGEERIIERLRKGFFDSLLPNPN
jgi:hypothetical protein